MTRARSVSKLGNPNVFTVDTDNNVGVNSTSPVEKLNVVGVVSATSFFGDGSNLSGITAGATLSAGSGAQRVVVTSLTSGTMTSAATDAELTYNSGTNTLSATTFSGALTGNVTGDASGSSGSCTGNSATATVATNAQGLTGTPDITVRNVTGAAGTFTGFVAFSTSISVGGTITYEDVTNIDSIGIVTARAGVQVGSGQSFGANGPTAVYYGDGSNLTGISAAGGITTTKYSPTANAIIQIGLGTAQHHELTLTAGFTTITTSGGSFGESHSLVLIQPSSGIATVGFSTFFQFPSGATPAMSEGSSKVDLVSFVVKDVAGNTGTGATELLASAGLNYS